MFLARAIATTQSASVTHKNSEVDSVRPSSPVHSARRVRISFSCTPEAYFNLNLIVASAATPLQIEIRNQQNTSA